MSTLQPLNYQFLDEQKYTSYKDNYNQANFYWSHPTSGNRVSFKKKKEKKIPSYLTYIFLGRYRNQTPFFLA